MQKEDIVKLINTKVEIKTEDGNDFDIPEEGSLGLLALGAKGLMAWRQKRKAVLDANIKAPVSGAPGQDKR